MKSFLIPLYLGAGILLLCLGSFMIEADCIHGTSLIGMMMICFGSFIAGIGFTLSMGVEKEG